MLEIRIKWPVFFNVKYHNIVKYLEFFIDNAYMNMA